MKKKRRKFSNNGFLKECKDGFFRHLRALGYKELCFKGYKYALNSLEQYMFDRCETVYTIEIGDAFLKHESRPQAHRPKMLETFHLVIRRFNDYVFKNESVFKLFESDRTCPEQFAEALDSYLDDMRSRSLKESTIGFNRDNLLKALKIFAAADIKSLKDIRPPDIYAAFEQFTDKRNVPVVLRPFFSYLHRAGIVKTDLAIFVPRKRRPQPVPSVFTKTEVEKFLSCFETESNMGKRD